MGLGLAAALLDRGASVLVLHTDILKVTVRTLGRPTPTRTGEAVSSADILRGPGCAGDFAAKAAHVQPLLLKHLDKARRDGYTLILEGTLALGLRQPDMAYVYLELDQEPRAERIQQKHPSAARAMAEIDTSPYQAALERWLPKNALHLNAALAPHTLVEQTVDWIEKSWHHAAPSSSGV
ncbi:hypothetical protein Hoch_6512 [Haliangium ochraceum DSM 14365]|uniref:Uncharacterized protein n=2 Tax=Haliangium ochraceum TaxID=80816 RepID=D0LQH2_HALO1|nr:hypothetical protein Hoch_6512 [Haliangium ochraceum DSM 14365]